MIQLCYMFKWSLTVPLDEMSLDQVLVWWGIGNQMIETEALTTAAAVWGGLKKAPPKIITSGDSQKPDKAAFYARYGDKIQRG